MSLNMKWTTTHAWATSEHGDNTNPSLFVNWAEHVAFAMMLTGVREITKDSLPTFVTRFNVLQSACGERTIGFNPDVYEAFVGAQGNINPETDAAFFRRMAKTAAGTADMLRRQWADREPGNFLHNLKTERLQKGLCLTCPSHHDQSVVHDGEQGSD